MAEKRRVLVVGATGAQGGGVARQLLRRGNFQVRALTRNPDSEKAQALRAAGAEVAAGDLSDRASLDAALKGCDAVFGVTSFWEHFEKEYDHGRNLLDAVAAAGPVQFIFSSLLSAQELTKGTLDVPHFELKAKLEKEARARGLNAIYVHVVFYFENLLYFFPPKPDGAGGFAMGFPQGDTPLAGVAVEDVGGVVAPLFERFDEFRGQVVPIAGDELPPQTYAEIMSRVLGQDVRYQYIPRETFAAYGFPGADDLANMFEMYRLYFPSRKPEIAFCRKLYPQMQTFETWLRAHKQDFQQMFASAAVKPA